MDTERRAVPVHWYNAVLAIELQHPDEPPEVALTTERRVIVLRAGSDDEALAKAGERCEALKPEVEYLNQYGDRVRWVCREVLSVTQLDADELRDGTEVFSELIPPADAQTND
jgi:hypothetical protein